VDEAQEQPLVARAPGVGAGEATVSDKAVTVARFGSFVLTSSNRFREPFDPVVEQIRGSLEEDPRVVAVQVPPIEDRWCTSYFIWPSPADEESILTGADRLAYLQFHRPLKFSVEVPAKNQPKRSDDDWVPTAYEVLWDGAVLLVSWQISADQFIGLSGGHIVGQILREALERIGCSLYVQGCNPACTHEFVHSSIRFEMSDEDGEEIQYRDRGRPAEKVALIPKSFASDPEFFLFNDLVMAAQEFMILKNRGRRILDSEVLCRAALREVLGISYARSEMNTESWLERIKHQWAIRRWRTECRRLISQVWLTLGNIEMLRREWEDFRFRFERFAVERELGTLFHRDHAGEVERVEKLDTGLVSASVQEVANRLDNRALLVATAVAAVSGAVGGAAVSGLMG